VKFSKGKFKNINKKLIASALALTLTSFSLAGCDDISISSINYSTNEQGDMDFTVNYDILKHCSFFRVYNNKIDKEYYTIGLIDEYNGSYFIKTYDIFTKEEIKISECSFKAITAVSHYLEDLDMVKESYTEEELKEILNIFLENYEKSKQLVKE